MNQVEQIGQLFMVGFHDPTLNPEIVAMIQQYRVGGVILFTRNIQSAAQVRQLTHDLQTLARDAGYHQPLLIATDQENGIVRRFGDEFTTFPGNMALGALGDEELTAEVAEATGREMQALGVNMNFAPDADVNNNPANPVIGVRSFGEDPQLVARLTAAAVRGYRQAGIVTTLKHFPGHGDTATDSHLAVPVASFDRARLEAVELVPFRAGIAAGADAVMIAHLSLPEIVAEPARLATYAPEVVRDLLRDHLGFTGVVITDCLEMKAIADTIGVARGAVQALLAGNDIILISHTYELQRAALAAAYTAANDGTLPAELLATAVARLQTLKRRCLSWDAIPDPQVAWTAPTAHYTLRDRAYGLSTTLVKDDAGLIPLSRNATQRIFVVAQPPAHINQAADIPYAHDALIAALRARSPQVTTAQLPPDASAAERQAAIAAGHAADLIIMVTINAFVDVTQASLMRDLLATSTPVIGIAAANPYDLAAFSHLSTYLATYEYTEPALVAAVRVLWGEIPARGRLPVSIPNVGER